MAAEADPHQVEDLSLLQVRARIDRNRAGDERAVGMVALERAHLEQQQAGEVRVTDPGQVIEQAKVLVLVDGGDRAEQGEAELVAHRGEDRGQLLGIDAATDPSPLGLRAGAVPAQRRGDAVGGHAPVDAAVRAARRARRAPLTGRSRAILRCSCMIEKMSASGRGGQPGT